MTFTAFTTKFEFPGSFWSRKLAINTMISHATILQRPSRSSVIEDLLGCALDFASNYVTISAADRHVIMHAKQSLLFNNETPWQKRNSNTLFDVTMGSFDGAETCELVGCYLLSQLTQISDINIGLYRDDGLAVLNQTPIKLKE